MKYLVYPCAVGEGEVNFNCSTKQEFSHTDASKVRFLLMTSYCWLVFFPILFQLKI